MTSKVEQLQSIAEKLGLRILTILTKPGTAENPVTYIIARRDNDQVLYSDLPWSEVRMFVHGALWLRKLETRQQPALALVLGTPPPATPEGERQDRWNRWCGHSAEGEFCRNMATLHYDYPRRWRCTSHPRRDERGVVADSFPFHCAKPTCDEVATWRFRRGKGTVYRCDNHQEFASETPPSQSAALF